jgi:predicted membrane protein (TIGR00267 family)
MQNDQVSDEQLGRRLILDELFDLSLYRKLRTITGPQLQRTLNDLVVVEERHFAFWQEFFKVKIPTLNFARRLKFWLIILVCRIFGAPAVDLVLEAIEVYGVRKYLTLWERYRNEPVAEAVRGILQDEFKHEDAAVTRLKERIINPDRVRNIFLGLNDGMVEILGAVSGFFASLGQNALVLIAGLTTAVAGSLSMAAGAYVATSSENEVRRTQDEKMRFLGEEKGPTEQGESALISAVIVGVSYFVGAAFPLLPVLFGARTPLLSIFTGGSMILLVSLTLAFLSGLEMKKRTLTNLILIALAVGVTYLIGLLVRTLLGIQI